MRKRSEAGGKAGFPDRELQIAVPHDPVNEMAVLGAMLVDAEIADRLLPLCPADAFYTEEHAAIREAIAEARRRKLALDPDVLARIYPEAEALRMEKIAASRPDVPENLDYHVETLLWDRQCAAATRGPVSSFLEALQDRKVDRESLQLLAQSVAKSFAGEDGKHLIAGKEVVRQMIADVERRIEGEAIYPFGIEGLDRYEDGEWRMIPGVDPGGFTLVTALSGSGKSLLLAHLAIASARQKRKVLFGSWEDEAPMTIELMSVFALRWSRAAIQRGFSSTLRTADGRPAKMTREEVVLLEEMAHKISGWVTFFKNPFRHGERLPTGRSATNDDHLDIIENEIAKTGCDVFMADLLHRALVDDSPSAERKALYRMRHISQSARCHTFAAHQQRAKDIETRASKTPTREGIIGAGAWLDVPRTILAPHLPAKWKNVPDDTLEIYILKQSKGPWPCGVEFDYEPATGQIANGRSFDVRATNDSGDGAFETAPASREKPKRAPSRAQKAFAGRRR